MGSEPDAFLKWFAFQLVRFILIFIVLLRCVLVVRCFRLYRACASMLASRIVCVPARAFYFDFIVLLICVLVLLRFCSGFALVLH